MEYFEHLRRDNRQISGFPWIRRDNTAGLGSESCDDVLSPAGNAQVVSSYCAAADNDDPYLTAPDLARDAQIIVPKNSLDVLVTVAALEQPFRNR